MQYICTMPDSLHLADFLEPVSLAEISNDEAYHDGQIGKDIELFDDEFPDLLAADIILLGCPEQRGNGIKRKSLSPGGSPTYIEFQKEYINGLFKK